MSTVPTTDLAKRVAALCKRKPTTPWSDGEIRVYRKLVKFGFFDDLDDFALIESYYAFERKKGERGVYRRDLSTFLNNAAGELDRATLWREQHPIVKPPRKIIPIELPSNEPPLVLSAEDEAQFGRFQQQFSAFKKVRLLLGQERDQRQRQPADHTR